MKAVVISKRKLDSHKFKFDLKLFLSFLSVALGIISGVLIYFFAKPDLDSKIFKLFISFFTDFSNKNSSEIIAGLIFSELSYFIIMFVLGLCIIGYPFALALSFWKAVGPALLFSYMYGTYAIKGAEYCVLVILPGKCLLILSMLLMTYSCFITGIKLKECAFDSTLCAKDEIKKYLIRSILILILIILSALLSFVSIKAFSKLFVF